MTFNNNTLAYSFSNASGNVGIGGGNGASVTLNGSGTVTFNSQNTYNGGTFLNAGKLVVSNDNQLGAAPTSPATNITFNGGKLSFAGTTSPTLSANRSILLSAAGTIDIPQAANSVSIGGLISGPGGLTTTGPGTLTLSGSNTFQGGVNVSSGVVVASNFGAFGSGAVTLNNGTKLVLATEGGISGFNSFGPPNGGAVISGGTLLTVTDFNNNEARSAWTANKLSVASGFVATFTYQDNMAAGGADGATFAIQSNGGPNSTSGTGALGNNGGGLGYNGINSAGGVVFNIYTGNTMGTQFVYSTGTANTPANTTKGSGGANNITAGSGGGTIGYAAGNVNLSSNDPIAVTLTYNAAAQTLTEFLQDKTIPADTFTQVYTGINFSTLLGGPTGYVGFTGGTGGANATQTFSNFSFVGGGGSASYANALNVAQNATSELNLATQNTTSMTFGNLTLNSGATLNITRSGLTTPNSAYTVAPSGTTLTGNASIGVANNGSGPGTFSPGPVIGNGNLTMNGPGTLAMSSSLSTYVGNTIINGGNVAITNAASLGTVGNTVTINGGALEVATGFTDITPITFNGANGALQVDAGQTYSNSTTFAVANNGAVTKTGPGTLLMTIPLPNAKLAANGGLIDLGGMTHTVAAVSINGGSISDGSLTGTSYAFSGAGGLVSANLLGAGALTVNNSGGATATLSGTNSYAAGTVVTQGVLAAGVASVGSGPITLAGGTFQPTPALTPGLSVQFYKGDPGQFNGTNPNNPLFNTYAAVNNFVATLPKDGGLYSTSTGTVTVLNFNGPNGANGQAFNGTNGPGNIGYTNSNNGADYTAILTGYILLPAGTAGFTTRSDDGSMLFIDGNSVVNNNAYQGMTNKSGNGTYTGGLHQIEIGYYQGTGGAGLEVFNDTGAATGVNLLSNSQLFTAVNATFTNNVVVSATSSLALTSGITDTFPSLSIGASGASTLHVINGPGTANFAATTFANSPVFDVQGANVLNLGTISGATGFSTSGSGTLIVAGNNNTGPVTVNGGSLLAIQQGGNPGTGPLGSAAITLNNGTLVLGNTSTAPTTFDMVSGNPVTLAPGSNDSIIAGSAWAAP